MSPLVTFPPCRQPLAVRSPSWQLTFAFLLVSVYCDAPVLQRCQAGSNEPSSSINESAAAPAGGQLTRTALEKAAQFPWYNPESHDLRSVIVPKAKAPPEIRAWEWPKWTGDWDWDWKWDLGFDFGNVVGSIFEVLIWVLLIGLIAAIVVMLARAYLESDGFWATGTKPSNRSDDDQRSDIERIENLPFEAQVKRLDLLSEAKQLADKDRFGEAIVYLFGYQLVQLDKNHLIRLTKGKTNRQYLRELRSRPRLNHIVEQTTIAFEDYFFGKHAIDRSRFELVWNELDSFHALVNAQSADTRPAAIGVTSESDLTAPLEMPS